jgi:MSHA biogenesis protein MshP
MCPERVRSGSAGFALMAALFIIVTLAAIAAYLLTISTGQVAAASQDEQASRAYQAARAGIDWAAYGVLRNSPASCTASQTIPLHQGLEGFWVQVNCSQIGTETEGGSSVDIFLVTATGCNRAACGPANTDATYVERQLQLTLAK